MSTNPTFQLVAMQIKGLQQLQITNLLRDLTCTNQNAIFVGISGDVQQT
jgi:hypothetical protein